MPQPTYLNLTKEQFESFAALPTEGAVSMLNLMKFKSRVATTGKTGAEQYQDYLKAAYPYFTKVNAKIVFQGAPKLTLIGPEENEWDKVLIVEYACKEDFIKMITMPGYPSKTRSEALEDSRLIFCKV